MACIDINSKVLCNFNNENIAAALNEIIDIELSKDVSRMNTELIDECVMALLEIEKEEDESFNVLIPLVNPNIFLKSIQPRQNNWKSLNVFARASIIAALLAASAMTANAAYKSATGIDLLANLSTAVHDKLVDWNIIESDKQSDYEIVQLGDDEELDEPSEAALASTEPTSAFEPSSEESTTIPQNPGETTTSTTRGYIDQLGDVDEDEKTTTKPSTTKKSPQNTTQKASIVEPEREPEKPYVSALEAEYNGFKTDYIYGEELSYDGITLTAVMSDGTKRPVSLSETDYTKSLNMNTTADYTLRIIYENCVIKIDITVRPDEETRGAQICENEDFKYFLSSKGAYITKYKGSNKSVSANLIDGKPVYAIGANTFKDSDIESITAVYVKKIYAFAFENCGELESAVFGNNITHLGEAAFKDSGIKSLSLKGELTEIPASLCENCTALTSVTLPENTRVIGASAFSECTALETVNNTANIEEAKGYAFYNCEQAQADSAIPNIKKAGEYAFAYCRKFEFGKLNESIEEINKYSFAYCNKLSEVNIPESFSVIPEGAFRGAHISALTLPEGLTKIEDYAFMSTEFRDLTVPLSVREIGTYALYSVRMRNISFGADVEKMGENAVFKSTRVNMSVWANTVPYKYAIENNINYTLIE